MSLGGDMMNVNRMSFGVNVIMVEDLDNVNEEFVKEFHKQVNSKEEYTVFGIIEECEWTRRHYSCLYRYFYYLFCDDSRCKLAEVYEKECESYSDSWDDMRIKFPGEYDESHSIPAWVLAAGVAASRIAFREKGWCRG